MTIPTIALNYSLSDVATSISNWFSSMWLIVAFAVAIPLAFMISDRIKGLFMH